MSHYFVDVAQATATVNYDMLTGKKFNKEAYQRTLLRAGLTGSAALGDCDVEVKVGGTTGKHSAEQQARYGKQQ